MAHLVPAGLLMLAAAAQPAAASDLAPAQVIQLAQSALQVLGYLDDPVDGIDGRKTREAYSAAAIALGWARIPAVIDRGVAEDLSQAAAPEVARQLGAAVDGRWVLASGDPIADLLACGDPEATAVVIDGLVAAFPSTDEVAVLALEAGRLLPLPPAGRQPGSAARGFRPAGSDTLESLTEGDIASWWRCPAD